MNTTTSNPHAKNLYALLLENAASAGIEIPLGTPAEIYDFLLDMADPDEIVHALIDREFSND